MQPIWSQVTPSPVWVSASQETEARRPPESEPLFGHTAEGAPAWSLWGSREKSLRCSSGESLPNVLQTPRSAVRAAAWPPELNKSEALAPARRPKALVALVLG